MFNTYGKSGWLRLGGVNRVIFCMAGLVRAVNKLLSEQNMTLLMIKIVVNNTMMSQWKNKPKLPSKSTNDSALLPDIKSSLVTSRDRLELVETETLQTLDLNNKRFAIDPLVVVCPAKNAGLDH